MANAFTDNKEHCDGCGVLVPHSQLDRIRAENDQQRQENDRLRLGLEEIDERLSELEGLSPEYVEDEIIEIRAMILDLLEGAKT